MTVPWDPEARERILKAQALKKPLICDHGYGVGYEPGLCPFPQCKNNPGQILVEGRPSGMYTYRRVRYYEIDGERWFFWGSRGT